MAEILKGAPAAAAMDEKTAAEAERLKSRGVAPKLAIFRIGERPDDVYYESSAIKKCAKVGVEAVRITLPADAGMDDVLAAVDALNRDDTVHGVLVLRPLPNGLDGPVRAALAPEKDVDGITDGSLSGVFTNTAKGFAPCTAQACIEMLHHYGAEISGKNAVVVGRSLVIGKPVAMLLLAENATVTVCHTKTVGLPNIVKAADIVIAAAGKAKMLSGECFRAGQTVIDVGFNALEDGSFCGDVDTAALADTDLRVSPVPGGVGSVTTSVLAAHTVLAAARTV